MKRKKDNFIGDLIRKFEDREDEICRLAPRDIPEEFDIPRTKKEIRQDKYWTIRNSKIPKSRICPLCNQIRLNSKQWVPPICKSCYSAEVREDLPDITVTAEGSSHFFIPLDRSSSFLARLYGVSMTTIHRWKDKLEIPIARLQGEVYEGDLIVTHYRIDQIAEIPKFLGVSGRAFGDILEFTRWKEGRIPRHSWERIVLMIERQT
tara:strand:- start:13473 stop:14090 length:618 start_codon:yes stop_codon:yes gene_type:complete